MSAPKRRWLRLGDAIGNAILGLLNLLIRPKISEQEALAIVQEAGAAKGWHLDLWGPVSRHLGAYDGLGFIDGTEVTVCWMVDGRTRELLQLSRSDEPNDDDLA